MAIDKTLADIKEAIKKFIEEGKTVEEQQKRFSQVSAILEKLKTIKELPLAERAVELGKIRLELHGIGIEEPKITELHDNNEDYTEDLTKAMSELLQEETDRLKKLAEEEEKKRIQAADARAAEEAHKKALDNQRKFLSECHVLLKELKVMKGQMVALTFKIDELISNNSKISHKIQLDEKRIEILLKALGDHRAQSAPKIAALEAKISELTKEDLDLKEKEKTVDSEVSAFELEVKSISEAKDKWERDQSDSGGATDYTKEIQEQTLLLQTKTALLDSRKLDQTAIKSKLSEIALALGNAVNEKEKIKKVEDDILQAVSTSQAELKKSQEIKSNISNELIQSNKQLATVSEEYKVKNITLTEKLQEGISKETNLQYKNEQETMLLQKELSDIQEELNINKDMVSLKQGEIKEVSVDLNEKQEELKKETDLIRKSLLQSDVTISEAKLAILEAEKTALTQEGEKLTQQLSEKNKEIEGKKPGLPATPSFVPDETVTLTAEQEQKVKELEAETAQLQKDIDTKQKEIELKDDEISKKVEEIVALVGNGNEEGPIIELEQKKIDELNQQLVQLKEERDQLVKEKEPLDKKLEGNIKKAEDLKKDSSTPAIVVDQKPPLISVPTGTSANPNAGGNTANSTSNTTSVTAATPQNTATSVSATPITPEEEEIERKWDKLGLPPDLSSSDDAVKNFWLMLFAMLTDVLAKTAAQDRKRVMALLNYAAGQGLRLFYTLKGNQQGIDRAQKRIDEASQDFKKAFGLPLDKEITRFQMFRAVVSIFPLLSSSTYVQRYALVDVKKKDNNSQNQQNTQNNSAQLQTPASNTTQNNPTVTTNNQNSASNSSTANTNTNPTVTANNQSSTSPQVQTGKVQNTQNATNNATDQSQTTTLKQIGDSNSNNAVNLAITPPPFEPPPPINQGSLQPLTSDNIPKTLSTLEKTLARGQENGDSIVLDAGVTKPSGITGFSREVTDLINAHDLEGAAKEQAEKANAAIAKKEEAGKENLDSNVESSDERSSSFSGGRKK